MCPGSWTFRGGGLAPAQRELYLRHRIEGSAGHRRTGAEIGTANVERVPVDLDLKGIEAGINPYVALTDFGADGDLSELLERGHVSGSIAAP